MTQTISNAVIRFFAGVDGRNWASVEALMQAPFHLDYSSFGAGPAADLAPSDIIKGWQGILPGFDATQHHLGPLDITEDGETAQVKASVIASHHIAEAEGGELWVVHGDYDIELAKADEGWILTSLTFQFKFLSGNGDLPALAQQKAAVS